MTNKKTTVSGAIINQLPNQPTNLIFTGVAGTGKTHQLLALQQLYDADVTVSLHEWRLQQVRHHSWREIICAVLLLEDRIMSVPEIMAHEVIKDKAAANDRQDNISQTLWAQLNAHAHPESKTVNSQQRSANFYFDKTESSQWYLLDDVTSGLLVELADLLSLYTSASNKQTAPHYTISRTCLVSFHQSYGYDEFVEGIRPHIEPSSGQMQYRVQEGAFLALCAKANADPTNRYAMLIDEINRANTAQVFGELMSVIEPTKRANSTLPMHVRLAYSGRSFSVPNNVDIYATMNTQDHSLTTLDMAFRRRFEFIACSPDTTLLTSIADASGVSVDLAKLMQAFNRRLRVLLSEEAQLGHAYFMNIDTITQLAQRLQRQVLPQIMQHIQQASTPVQHRTLLFQILYGCSEERVGPIQGCLLVQPTTDAYDSTNMALSFIHDQGDTGYSNARESISGFAKFNPDFIEVSQGITTSSNDGLFLSAKPYQQLYEHG